MSINASRTPSGLIISRLASMSLNVFSMALIFRVCISDLVSSSLNFSSLFAKSLVKIIVCSDIICFYALT